MRTAGLWVFIATVGLGQLPPTIQFTANSNLVIVDVVVTDKSGKPI